METDQKLLNGRVAIVTGAASGIGLSIARALSAAGARCVLADLEASDGAKVAVELSAAGTAAEFVATDLSKREEVRRMVDVAAERFGRIDILVNNAGLQHVAPVVEFPEERWEFLISVMLTGTFLCCKYVLPHMIRGKWGRIINISSVHGKVASPFKVAYISAKHGVLGLTKVVALETGQQGVTCNAICPAYVRTPLVEKQIEDQARHHGISAGEVVTKIMTGPAAIQRLLEPEEVASLALYLCSEAASGITGAAIDIDLGMTAR
ncbi:MAG TPA: 3-hydroxybutyrate dehydrogenase [Verrucomicrobiae bacterium]|nr:3-hydroxybutyrate dehydrogenase [Verrucomicrobiae bacterium]